MTTEETYDGIPLGYYAFPGPLRDQLITALKSGAKTTTCSLLEEYERAKEELPKTGDREAVVDSNGEVVLITRIAKVSIVPLAEVTLEHALGEGEGYESVEQWRAGHERFWTSDDYRASMGQPPIEVNDDTKVVCQTLVVERIL